MNKLNKKRRTEANKFWTVAHKDTHFTASHTRTDTGTGTQARHTYKMLYIGVALHKAPLSGWMYRASRVLNFQRWKVYGNFDQITNFFFLAGLSPNGKKGEAKAKWIY